MRPTVVHAGGARAGRRFEPVQERDLRAAALHACMSLARNHDRMLIVEEMPGPVGIPDLTVFVGDSVRLTQRLASTVPAIRNQVDATIVSATSAKRTSSFGAISRRLGWDVETVERRMPSLLRSGALHLVARDRVLRSEVLGSFGWLYAVEMKVRDRSAAIQQARTYSLWADSYVVVMGEITDRARETLKADVERDRAGAVVDGIWLRRPTLQRRPVASRLWASEYLVAALRSANYQPSLTA